MSEKMVTVQLGQNVVWTSMNVQTMAQERRELSAGKVYTVPEAVVDSWRSARVPFKVVDDPPATTPAKRTRKAQ